jgi:hypothetical protein
MAMRDKQKTANRTRCLFEKRRFRREWIGSHAIRFILSIPKEYYSLLISVYQGNLIFFEESLIHQGGEASGLGIRNSLP